LIRHGERADTYNGGYDTFNPGLTGQGYITACEHCKLFNKHGNLKIYSSQFIRCVETAVAISNEQYVIQIVPEIGEIRSKINKTEIKNESDNDINRISGKLYKQIKDKYTDKYSFTTGNVQNMQIYISYLNNNDILTSALQRIIEDSINVKKTPVIITHGDNIAPLYDEASQSFFCIRS